MKNIIVLLRNITQIYYLKIDELKQIVYNL